IDTEENRDTLVIPEIKDEKTLFTVLETGKWIAGAPQVSATREDKDTAANSKKNRLKKNSLFLSALFYDLGNLSFMVSGYQRAKHNRDGKWTASDISEMMVGIMFSVGDVLLTAYGSEMPKNPLIEFSDELSQHLKRHGVVMPQVASPDAI